MMPEDKNTPSVRFAGFTDAWERRKIELEIQLLPFKPLLATPEVNGKHPIIQQGDTPVLGYSNMLPFSDYGRVVLFGDHTLSLYRPNAPFLIATDGIRIVKSEDENSAFLLCFLERYKPAPEGYKRYFSILADRIGSKPSTQEEREKIGSFFEKLDRLITLHRRKYEKLVSIKKSMLDKMFPKKGELVPEVRFAGFTDAWERRKLGDFGSVAMDKRVFKEQTTESGDVPFYKIGTFGGSADAYISNELYDEYTLKYPHPSKGDILISASGSIGRTVIYSGNREYFQDSNIVWLQHDNRLQNTFLRCFYEVVKWEGIEGSTIKRLYNKNMLATEIYFPCPDEQRKIGDYFTQLDTLITLHRHKLEKLQNIKKACLEKMFV